VRSLDGTATMPQGLPALTIAPASGGVRPLIVVVCRRRKRTRTYESETNIGVKPKKVRKLTGLFAKNAQSHLELLPRGAVDGRVYMDPLMRFRNCEARLFKNFNAVTQPAAKIRFFTVS
jgi:hypothetical protein